MTGDGEGRAVRGTPDRCGGVQAIRASGIVHACAGEYRAIERVRIRAN